MDVALCSFNQDVRDSDSRTKEIKNFISKLKKSDACGQRKLLTKNRDLDLFVEALFDPGITRKLAQVIIESIPSLFSEDSLPEAIIKGYIPDEYALQAIKIIEDDDALFKIIEEPDTEEFIRYQIVRQLKDTAYLRRIIVADSSARVRQVCAQRLGR